VIVDSDADEAPNLVMWGCLILFQLSPEELKVIPPPVLLPLAAFYQPTRLWQTQYIKP
jgi:hypothetical protein